MNFAKRMDEYSSAIFTQLDIKKQELIRSGREVFNFSIGTPDMPPAQHIIDAMQQAVGVAENHKYAVRDLPELVENVIDWYLRRFNVELMPEEVMSLAGSQDGLSHIALTLADAGDTVLVPDPGYPIFSIGPMLAGAKLCKMPLLRENEYLIDFDAIDATAAHSAKLMIVSYPNNPVTAIAPTHFYEKLVWFAKKYDIAVLHDNAYSELVFDGKESGSFLSTSGAKDVGVEFNSLSKSYNMTGCRISFALGNKEMIKAMKTLKSHLDYGIFLPVQRAAIAALTGPQGCLDKTRAIYESRRNLLIDEFAAIGWHIEKSPATMFVWAPVPVTFAKEKRMSSLDFTLELLEKTGVIVVPGSSFGAYGEGYVRLALVQDEASIRKAAQLIKSSGLLGTESA